MDDDQVARVIKLRREKDRVAIAKVKRHQEQRELAVLKALLAKEEKSTTVRRIPVSRGTSPATLASARRQLLVALNKEVATPLNDEPVADIDIDDDDDEEQLLDLGDIDLDSDDDDDDSVQRDLVKQASLPSWVNHGPGDHNKDSAVNFAVVDSRVTAQPPLLDFSFTPGAASGDEVTATYAKQLRLVNPTHDRSYTLPAVPTFTCRARGFPAAGCAEIARCLTVQRVMPTASSSPTRRWRDQQILLLQQHQQSAATTDQSTVTIPPGGCVSIRAEFRPTAAFYRHYRQWRESLVTDLAAGDETVDLEQQLAFDCAWNAIPSARTTATVPDNSGISVRRERVSVTFRLVEPRPALEIDAGCLTFRPVSSASGPRQQVTKWQCNDVWTVPGSGWTAVDATAGHNTFRRSIRLRNSGLAGVWIHAQCEQSGVEVTTSKPWYGWVEPNGGTVELPITWLQPTDSTTTPLETELHVWYDTTQFSAGQKPRFLLDSPATTAHARFPCLAIQSHPLVEVLQAAVDLKVLKAGLEYRTHLDLVNRGPQTELFEVIVSQPPDVGLTITADRTQGEMAVGQQQAVWFTVTPDSAINETSTFTIPLSVKLSSCGMQFTTQFTGRVTSGSLLVPQNRVDAGTIALGSVRPLTIPVSTRCLLGDTVRLIQRPLVQKAGNGSVKLQFDTDASPVKMLTLAANESQQVLMSLVATSAGPFEAELAITSLDGLATTVTLHGTVMNLPCGLQLKTSSAHFDTPNDGALDFGAASRGACGNSITNEFGTTAVLKLTLPDAAANDGVDFELLPPLYQGLTAGHQPSFNNWLHSSQLNGTIKTGSQVCITLRPAVNQELRDILSTTNAPTFTFVLPVRLTPTTNNQESTIYQVPCTLHLAPSSLAIEMVSTNAQSPLKYADFGSVFVGGGRHKHTFTIANKDTKALRINVDRPDPDSEAFSWSIADQADDQTEIEIGPGASISLLVTFRPRQAAKYHARIRIRALQPHFDYSELKVAGVGVESQLEFSAVTAVKTAQHNQPTVVGTPSALYWSLGNVHVKHGDQKQEPLVFSLTVKHSASTALQALVHLQPSHAASMFDIRQSNTQVSPGTSATISIHLDPRKCDREGLFECTGYVTADGRINPYKIRIRVCVWFTSAALVRCIVPPSVDSSKRLGLQQRLDTEDLVRANQHMVEFFHVHLGASLAVVTASEGSDYKVSIDSVALETLTFRARVWLDSKVTQGFSVGPSFTLTAADNIVKTGTMTTLSAMAVNPTKLPSGTVSLFKVVLTPTATAVKSATVESREYLVAVTE